MKRQKTIHTEEYVKLIDALCSERKRLGLSQAEVSRALGMSQSEISKIETNERRIDILEFKELLQVYRIQDSLKLQALVKKFLGLGKL